MKTSGGAAFDISPAILTTRADTVITLGRIREGEIVRYDARLRNVGADPLVVKDVATSCGCTSVEWTKQPIAPNATGDFSLKLDTRGMWGMVHKLVEIDTSAAPKPFRITIKAEVVPET